MVLPIWLTDGATSGRGHATTGEDTAVLTAPGGMEIKLTIEMLYLPSKGKLQVFPHVGSSALGQADESGARTFSGHTLPTLHTPPWEQPNERTVLSHGGVVRVTERSQREDEEMPAVWRLRVELVPVH
jgi:hypothetical protein